VTSDSEPPGVPLPRAQEAVEIRRRGSPVPGYAAPGVELLAHTDPGTTIAAFPELTGLDADPV
jgi:hypothetical protein